MIAGRRRRWAAALVESDRRYFELASARRDLDGCRLSWMVGMEPVAGAGVVHRVRPEAIAEPGPWVGVVTAAMAEAGLRLARVYLDRPEPRLDEALAEAGYRRRVEVGFLVEGGLSWSPSGPRRGVALREVVDDAGWEAKRKLHAGADVAADGHVTAPDLWVELERAKWATGEMQAFLVEVDGEPCGAVAALEVDGLLRAKNVFVVPERRREGVASEAIRLLSRRAADRGLAATGIFGVYGNPGAAVYTGLRMEPVVEQVELAKPLPDPAASGA